MSLFDLKPRGMVAEVDALLGRDEEMPIIEDHFVFGLPLKSAVPEGFEEAIFGMGCFWGVERIFWKLPGVWLTMVGYASGYTKNPTYREVCSGFTGHSEVVRVIYDPKVITFEGLLRHFWENHDPTQGMRQGNDVGSQYRSGVYYYTEEQRDQAEASRALYQHRLMRAGRGIITTEILPAPTFYFAEDYHQQYLAKNPNGYCGIGGTGVSCPIGLGL